MGQGDRIKSINFSSHYRVTNRSINRKGSTNTSGSISNFMGTKGVTKDKVESGSNKAYTSIEKTFNILVTTSRELSWSSSDRKA